ncbi:unnamed protein product, partial [Hapterophycus canaliculatus]
PPLTHEDADACTMSFQVSDGAAASLLMTRANAARRGLRPLGVFRSYAVVGVPPEVMGELL